MQKIKKSMKSEVPKYIHSKSGISWMGYLEDYLEFSADGLSGNAKTALSGELKSPQTQHSLDLDNLCTFGGKCWRQD